MILNTGKFWSRPVSRATLLSLVGVGVILLIGDRIRTLTVFPGPRQEPVVVTAAAVRESAQTTPTLDSEPITVEVDATQNAPAEERLLETTLDSVARLAGPAPARPDEPLPGAAADTLDAAQNWLVWGRLKTERSPVTLSVAASEAVVSAYAVHSREGATVVLCNKTRQKTPTQLRVRLARGVYKIERLAYIPPLSVAAGVESVLRREELCASEGPVGRLDRLESGDLANPDILAKPIWLKPQEVCLIRYTDVAYKARAAFYETRDQVKTIRASVPTTANRLSAVFKAGEPYISGLTAGGRNTLEKRLGCIHRLLLLTAQAHSMHHNSQERKNVTAEAGAALMRSIERLNTALTETSAALLGLVPQIDLTQDQPAAVPQPESGRASGSTLQGGQINPAPAQSATVTIALANTGARSVDLVKIGLDVSALPPNVQCEPGDPAMFGTLHPGQTARATFRLRWPADAAPTDRQCVGDVSYFLASAPAHLRLSPW